jgi:hypothetical protein
MAMSVAPETVTDAEEVFLLAKRLGADAFLAAVSTSFGRAGDLGMCAQVDHELQHRISDALAP